MCWLQTFLCEALQAPPASCLLKFRPRFSKLGSQGPRRLWEQVCWVYLSGTPWWYWRVNGRSFDDDLMTWFGCLDDIWWWLGWLMAIWDDDSRRCWTIVLSGGFTGELPVTHPRIRIGRLRFDGWRLQWKLDSWIIGVESWANDWTLIVGMIGILNGDFRCQWWKTLGDEPGSPKAHVRMRRHGQWMGTSHATNGDIYRYICAGWWGSPWINGGLLKNIPISIPWGWWSRSETSETQRGVVFWLWYGVITTDILWTMDNWKDYCNDHLLE